MDWVRFLEENNIHFVSRGPNTKRGEVSIHCPMCGDDDPSEHLGINLTKEGWGCLRDGSHRGKAPRSLIKAILGCSGQQADLIVRQYSHSDPDTLEAALASLESEDFELAEQTRNQELGPQFEDFSHIKRKGVAKRFYRYLQNRMYEDVESVVARYELRCALTGRYKDRIIIPVRHSGELMGWTSRAIAQTTNAPRYLMSSDAVKTTVFNYDSLKKGGQRLVITEGPFDAIRIDNHNFERVHEVDFRATCTFGTSPTISQMAVLRALAQGFDETWVLFDKGADGPGSEVAQWVGAKQAYLPPGVEDPGEMKIPHLNALGKEQFTSTFAWFGLSDIAKATLLNRGQTMADVLTQNNALLKKLWHKP